MATLDVLAAVAALARSQYGAFSRHQVDPLGVSDGTVDRAVRAGLWVRRAWGVYALTAFPRSAAQRLMVAILAAGHDAFVAGSGCLALHGIDRFHLGGDGLEVLVVGENRSIRSGVVRYRRTSFLPAEHRTVVRNLPSTTLARGYVDAARTIPGRRLAAAVDDGVLTRKVTVDRIQAVDREVPANGRPGTRLLRALLDTRSTDGYLPPESELEREVLATAVGAGLPLPQLQSPPPWRSVERERLDLLWREAKLIVECDGRRWHARVDAFAADRRRDRLAARHGYGLVRATWEDVQLFRDELADDLLAIYRRRLTA